MPAIRGVQATCRSRAIHSETISVPNCVVWIFWGSWEPDRWMPLTLPSLVFNNAGKTAELNNSKSHRDQEQQQTSRRRNTQIVVIKDLPVDKITHCHGAIG